MDKFKNFITKVTATWAAIGAALITLSATGFINIPDVIENLFSQNVSDALNVALQASLVALGAVIEFYQILRAIFAVEPIEGGEIKTLSASDKVSFTVNPFKLL